MRRTATKCNHIKTNFNIKLLQDDLRELSIMRVEIELKST